MLFDDNYVVRIYRRESGASSGRREHDLVALTGTVQNAATGKETPFHSPGELWLALAQAHKGASKSNKRQT